VTEVWWKLLGLPSSEQMELVDFFELGGNSFKATALFMTLSRRFSSSSDEKLGRIGLAILFQTLQSLTPFSLSNLCFALEQLCK